MGRVTFSSLAWLSVNTALAVAVGVGLAVLLGHLYGGRISGGSDGGGGTEVGLAVDPGDLNLGEVWESHEHAHVITVRNPTGRAIAVERLEALTR